MNSIPWPCRGDKFTQNLVCLYCMGRHRQGSYSSISCLEDLPLVHLRGTGWCPAPSGIMLWPREHWTWGSLAQVRHSAALHRKGTSHHSVCLGQKCLLPSQTICSCYLIAVCCGSSSSQGICTVPPHTSNIIPLGAAINPETKWWPQTWQVFNESFKNKCIQTQYRDSSSHNIAITVCKMLQLQLLIIDILQFTSVLSPFLKNSICGKAFQPVW